MAELNVQIKQRNGEIWDNLYPKTKAQNVITTGTQDFVSLAEKATWNDKQSALGFTAENVARRGVANGYPELDAQGKIPSSQLPSYVDDVVVAATLSAFAVSGETGKIYIAEDTNITYRWSGTKYVVISDTIAIGETASSAHRGDHGKIAYTHSISGHAPANAQKNSEITKGEIEAKLTGAITSHSHASVAPLPHADSHITGSDKIANAVANGASGLLSGVDKGKIDKLYITTVSATAPSSPIADQFWYEIL